MQEADLIIAGGGIAGLASALSISTANPSLSVVVVEQAEQFSEVGAGIQLGPNAWRALKQIGGMPLYQSVHEYTSFASHVEIRDAVNGKVLRQGRVDDCAQIYGEPFGSIHRAHLHKALLDACQTSANILLRPNTGFSTFDIVSYATPQVRAKFANGDTLRARALLGCDGVRSAVRAQLWPNANAYRTNLITVRALFDASVVPEQLIALGQAQKILMWWGPNMHVVLYNVHQGRQLNMVAFTQAKTTQLALQKLSTGFAHTPVAPLFAFSEAFSPWPMWHQPRLGRWSQGPVSLAGDAAHASMPFLAQGAGMALEDAAQLGSCFATHAEPSLAFQSYEHLRYARTMRAQRQSALMRWVDHASGPMRLGRNAVMSMLAHQHFFTPISWLYRDPH